MYLSKYLIPPDEKETKRGLLKNLQFLLHRAFLKILE
jgi:hypothetical protein